MSSLPRSQSSLAPSEMPLPVPQPSGSLYLAMPSGRMVEFPGKPSMLTPASVAEGALLRQLTQREFDGLLKVAAAAQADSQPLSEKDVDSFAEFFAREFDLQRARALFEPAGWYQQQMGGREDCSDALARQVRDRTIERCVVMTTYIAGQPRIEMGIVGYRPVVSVRLRAMAYGLTVLFCLGLLLLLSVAVRDTDPSQMVPDRAHPSAFIGNDGVPAGRL